MSVHRRLLIPRLLRSALLVAALAAASGLAPPSSAADTSDAAAIWAQPPVSRALTIQGRSVQVSVSIFQLDAITTPVATDDPERVNVAVSVQALDDSTLPLTVTATRIRMERLLGQNRTFRRPLEELSPPGSTLREFSLGGAPVLFRAHLRLRTTLFLQAGNEEIAVPMGLVRVRDNVIFLRGGLNDDGGTITE